jgi:hypothetical protein
VGVVVVAMLSPTQTVFAVSHSAMVVTVVIVSPGNTRVVTFWVLESGALVGKFDGIDPVVTELSPGSVIEVHTTRPFSVIQLCTVAPGPEMRWSTSSRGLCRASGK